MNRHSRERSFKNQRVSWLRVLCLLLALSLGLQLPLGNQAAFATTVEALELSVSDTALKVYLSYTAAGSGQMFYVLTAENNATLTAAEIETLAVTGTGVLANGSAAISLGGPPIELILDLSGPNFEVGKAYKLQTVLKEGSSYTAVSVNRFFKGSFIQTPQIEKSLPDGFNVRLSSAIPGMVYLAMIQYDQPSPAPSPNDLITATQGSFDASVNSGLQANTSQLMALRGAETLLPIPYKIFYTFVDAYGAVHCNGDGSAFSLPAQSALGNTLNVMYYDVGDLASKADDRIIVKAGTGINQTGDTSLYHLSFTSDKGTLTADSAEFTLGCDGNTLYLLLDQVLAERLYDAGQFDGGSFSLTVDSGGTLSPQYIAGFDSLTTPLTLTDLSTANAGFLGNLTFEDYGTLDVLEDDYLVLSLPGVVSIPGGLAMTVAEGEVRGYGSTVTTLIQDVDFFVMPYSTNEVKITFSPEARAQLNQMSYPAIKVAPSGVPWVGLTLATSGNYAVVNLTSSNAKLSQASIDGRPVQNFDCAMKDYVDVPVSYSKHGEAGYLESASYGAFLTEAENATLKLSYHTDLHKLMVTVTAESGAESTYSFGIVANTLSFKRLMVNGQLVPNFYSNMGFVSVMLPAGQNNPMIEAQFENEAVSLEQLVLTETGALPGEKTFRYSIPGYPDIGFTLLMMSHGNNDNGGSQSDNLGQASSPAESIIQIGSGIRTTAATSEIVSAVTGLQGFIGQAQSESQLYSALIELNRPLASIGAWLNSQPSMTSDDANRLTGELSQLTQQVALSLERIESTDNAVSVAAAYVQTLGEIRQRNLVNQASIDNQVEAMLTRLSDRSGTVALPVLPPQGGIAAPPSLIQTAISQQSQYIDTLRGASNSYFSDGSRSVPMVITLTAPPDEPMRRLQVELPSGLSEQLNGAGVNGLRISNGYGGVTAPTSLFRLTGPITMEIQPEFNRGITVVGFEIFQNNRVVSVLDNPITLSFNLRQFGLSGEDWTSLAVFRLSPDNGELVAVGGRINPIEGSIRVTRGTLSQYTVMKSSKTFSDADQSWAKAEINAALNKGIIAAGDKFEPQAAITRAEFASWIAKAYGLKASGKAIPFKDVPKTHPQYNEIAAIYEAGLIDGKTKTSFDPGGTLTANELAVILGKTLVKFDNKQTSSKVTSKHLATLKAADTASWAQSDMALLQELGFSNQKELAQLKGQVTKEVAAAAFMKAYQSS